ncbi:Coronin-7 [Irineochytrium annulatum]|nr:Coronin-7 [Irineochytrium annulatum]
MPPFKVSKYKNTTLHEGNRDIWAALTSVHNGSTTNPVPVRCSAELTAVPGSSAGTIQFVTIDPESEPLPRVLHNGCDVLDFAWGFKDAGTNARQFATAAVDGKCKVWGIGSSSEWQPKELTSFSMEGPGVQVLFHPTAASLVAAAGKFGIELFDVAERKGVLKVRVEASEGFSFKADGSLIGAITTEKAIVACDPRAGPEAQIKIAKAHQGSKLSRLLWLGDSDCVFTTGFGRSREREISMWDVRGGKAAPLYTERIDTSTGVLTPKYDVDTGLLYFWGKGDTRCRWLEVGADLGITPSTLSFSSSTPMLGFDMVPKRSVVTKDCEVVRLLGVTSSHLLPFRGIVPRKLSTFQSDLYPDTIDDVPALSAKDWLDGQNKLQSKVSMDPRANTVHEVTSSFAGATITENPAVTSTDKAFERSETSTTSNPQSSYRFLEGKSKVMFEDLTCLHTNTPNETTGLDATADFVCFPVSGPGGRVGVWRTTKTGRLPTKIPAVIHGSDLSDFKINHLNSSELATFGSDCIVKFWLLTEMAEDVVENVRSINARGDKGGLLLYHPTVSDMLLTTTTGQSNAIKIWNAANGDCCFDVSVTSPGENFVQLVEIVYGEKETSLRTVTRITDSLPQFGMAFAERASLNAREVEVARAWRITKSNVCIVSFTLPRLRRQYFSDDLFPVMPRYSPLDFAEFTSGKEFSVTMEDLAPPDMIPLSRAPISPPTQRKAVGVIKTDNEEKGTMLDRMKERAAGERDKMLPQDQMEGVDESEWDD